MISYVTSTSTKSRWLSCNAGKSIARRWVKSGKATSHWNDAGLYYVRLVVEPSFACKTQKIAVGCNPGKNYTGIAVQSAKFTLFTAHLVLHARPHQRKTWLRCY
ncbi:MAG: hypothetical protein F6K17_31130 [Okeania sp. SIO3C4]|nr:hypothetical protein [Okeania sp. SIO3C4]